MRKKEITEYRITEEERAELTEIYRALLEFCQIHRLPMFASIAVANDENGTEYMSNIYTAQSHGRVLYDDVIRKHLLITNGFEPVPPRERLSITIPAEKA